VVHHFARERIQSKEVTFHYIPTTDMAADMMTKILPANKHEACVAQRRVYELCGA
jgi:hypothetical protein